MRWREFILFIGGAAAAWPLATAQQSMPVISFLSGSSLKSVSNEVTAFQDGLKEVVFSMVKMSESNIAGLSSTMISCLRWRLSWLLTG